jgi:hypothetical protein
MQTVLGHTISKAGKDKQGERDGLPAAGSHRDQLALKD